MDEVVELIAAAVVALAAATCSHFGVSIESLDQARTTEARSVRRSPVADTRPAPRADCEKPYRTYA